ncbi:hypothetical protein BJ742DRAFT_671588, partial [Cladochytrium replicatum]
GSVARELLPQLHESGLGFADLFLDFPKYRIRPMNAQCTIAFSLMEVRNPPEPPSNARILGRHVRMGLFDKSGVLSNVHYVPAIFNYNSQKAWKFSRKGSLLFPRDDENTCFARTSLDIKLCLLFECCLVVARQAEKTNIMNTTTSKDVFEVCIGWGILPLLTADGGPVENRTYEIKLFRGSPFDKEGKSLESPVKSIFKGIIQQLIAPSKSPKLVIRLWKLGKSVLRDLNKLPQTFIYSLSGLPVLAFYREALARTLLSTKKVKPLGPQFEPALALLPRIAGESDLMVLLVAVWDQKLKSAKRSEKKSFSKMKKKFTESILSVWPLLFACDIPPHIPGDEERIQTRQTFIRTYQEFGVVECLTSRKANITFRPFSAQDEVCYNYLGLLSDLQKPL